MATQKVYHTSEEMFAALEAKANKPVNRLLRPFRRAWHWLFHEAWWDVLAFYQRGRRGWAGRDAASMDHYLARIIGEMLESQAANLVSYPGDGCGFPEGETLEAWQAYLRRLAMPFQDYVASYPQFSENEQYQQMIEGMCKLYDHYGYLWD